MNAGNLSALVCIFSDFIIFTQMRNKRYDCGKQTARSREAEVREELKIKLIEETAADFVCVCVCVCGERVYLAFMLSCTNLSLHVGCCGALGV